MSLINAINYPLIYSVGGIDYAREILKFQGVNKPEKYFDLETKRYCMSCPPKWVKIADLKLEVAEFTCGQENNWIHPQLYGYAKTMYGIGQIVKFYHKYGIIWADLKYEDGSIRRALGVKRSGYIEDFQFLPDYVEPKLSFVEADYDDDDEEDEDPSSPLDRYKKLSSRSQNYIDSLIHHLYELEND